jgi:dipeptidyl aminopeptidase/acylaminoacyl peptidase
VLSPDGGQVVFPDVVLNANDSHSYLEIMDLKSSTIRPLSNPSDPIDDDAASWSPDGSYMVIGRRYTDDRFTRGKQLYRMNPADGSVEPLLVDPKYGNSFFSFDPTGTQLVIQRSPDPVAMNDPTNLGLPEIWTLDIASKTLTKVADDAFFGRWVP